MAKHGGNQGGRAACTRLLSLEVGESVFMPWIAPGANDALRCRIKYARRKTGRAFRLTPTARGLTVLRLPDPASI